MLGNKHRKSYPVTTLNNISYMLYQLLSLNIADKKSDLMLHIGFQSGGGGFQPHLTFCRMELWISL